MVSTRVMWFCSLSLVLPLQYLNISDVCDWRTRQSVHRLACIVWHTILFIAAVDYQLKGNISSYAGIIGTMETQIAFADIGQPNSPK